MAKAPAEHFRKRIQYAGGFVRDRPPPPTAEQIAADVEAFRRRGGKIQQIPDGASGDKWLAK